MAEALKERYGGSIAHYPHKAGIRYRLSSKKSWKKVGKEAKAAWGRYGLESFLSLAKQAELVSGRPSKTRRTALKHIRTDPLWSCRRGSVDPQAGHKDGEGQAGFRVDQIR